MNEGVCITLSREELKNLIREAIAECNSPDNANSNDVQQSETLIKIDDVCELLKVSKVTIHKWKKEGKIPFHRISNRVFFKKTEILGAIKAFDFNQKGGGIL